MKRIIILIFLINLVLSATSQEIEREKKVDIVIQFDTDWMYFRMQANPLFSYEQTHDGPNWKSPSSLFKPEKMRVDYLPDIKISKWGRTKSYSPNKFRENEYWEFYGNEFYLLEKKDGYLGLKKSYFPETILDSIQLNVYDSIFPYDNRFLAVYLGETKNGDHKFSFQSGNVLWGEWKDVGYRHDIDVVGYIRGVQFGIENVYKFRQDFSDKIKQFRPEFPDYVYTENRSTSLLTNGFVIIGAPAGKEDQLVEYIYYSNLPEKTGDSDETHYYEMRYILPTQIKSIEERRLEKRRLSDEEQKYILDGNNGMLLYLDGEESINLRAYKNSLKEKELNEVIK